MADDSLFSVELVTPERVLLTGVAREVITRTGEGDVSFLAGHTPLVGTLEPGVIRVVRPDGDEEQAAAHGGFVQVEQGVDLGDDDGITPSRGTRVTLLVGVGELADEIDVGRARAALELAEARVTELSGSGGRGGAVGAPDEDQTPDAELIEAEAALRRAQVRLESVEVNAGTATA